MSDLRNCRDCKFCNMSPHHIEMFCVWEKHSMPAPVYRARLWGASPPKVNPGNYAETCTFFEKKEETDEG